MHKECHSSLHYRYGIKMNKNSCMNNCSIIFCACKIIISCTLYNYASDCVLWYSCFLCDWCLGVINGLYYRESQRVRTARFCVKQRVEIPRSIFVSPRIIIITLIITPFKLHRRSRHFEVIVYFFRLRYFLLQDLITNLLGSRQGSHGEC